MRVGPDNGSYTWNYIEHEKGKLEIDARADEAITEAVRNGINVIMVLDFKGNWIYMEPPRKTNWREARFREINNGYDDPPGVANANPQMYEAYLQYVDYMVRHFKDRVAYFEIGNEWNHLGVEQYMKDFFEPTYAAIKKAAPNARVMLGNPAGFETALILGCLGPPWEVGPLIMEVNEFFSVSSYEPTRLERFMNAITDLIIAFSEMQMEAIGQNLLLPGHQMLCHPAWSGISISDDNMSMLSERAYEVAALPYNSRIAKHFDGIALHSCSLRSVVYFVNHWQDWA